jgi:carbon monoxide dehydrogenase subunit G
VGDFDSARDMKLQGSSLIAAPPAVVFARLLEPAVLQQSIPGCERLELAGPDDYVAHLKLGLGAIKGSYRGKVRIADRKAPESFTLHLEGQGGPGFVKGISAIALKAEGRATRLSYAADVQVGGLIAAIGSRMIDAAAKKLAGEFFQRFGAIVMREAGPAR